MARHAELADDRRVERRLQRFGDLERDGDAASARRRPTSWRDRYLRRLAAVRCPRRAGREMALGFSRLDSFMLRHVLAPLRPILRASAPAHCADSRRHQNCEPPYRMARPRPSATTVHGSARRVRAARFAHDRSAAVCRRAAVLARRERSRGAGASFFFQRAKRGLGACGRTCR